MTNEEIIAKEIAELEQQPINYSIAEKLAYLYTVQDHMTPKEITYDSGTDLSNAIRGKNVVDVVSVFDELMRTLSVLSPKLYNATIERLRRI